jgi:hypothetical protein
MKALHLGRARLFARVSWKPRLRWAQVRLAIRRAHLYSGLALVPFVVLYGATAFLFNHPSVGSELAQRSLSRAELAAHGGAALPPPLVIAEQLVAAAGEARWSLDPERELQMRGRLSLQGRDAEREHTLSIEQGSGAALWSARPRASSAEPERRAIELPAVRAALASTAEAARAALASAGAAPSELRVRSAPVLELGLIVEGERRRASYDLAKGELVVHPAGEERARSWRSFFLRLHTAHGYPAELGARTAWAVLVDLMSAALVLWALSGLLMWWQMKLLRRAGLVALGGGLIAALVLGERLWGLLA